MTWVYYVMVCLSISADNEPQACWIGESERSYATEAACQRAFDRDAEVAMRRLLPDYPRANIHGFCFQGEHLQ